MYCRVQRNTSASTACEYSRTLNRCLVIVNELLHMTAGRARQIEPPHTRTRTPSSAGIPPPKKRKTTHTHTYNIFDRHYRAPAHTHRRIRALEYSGAQCIAQRLHLGHQTCMVNRHEVHDGDVELPRSLLEECGAAETGVVCTGVEEPWKEGGNIV